MKKSNDWLLSVTAGKWQSNGILEAKKMGINVIAVDGDKNAEGFKYADIYFSCDINDINYIIKKINSKNIKISGAISFCSEVGMKSVNIIKNKLNLPCKNKFYMNLIDKIEQKTTWEKKSLPITKNWSYFSNFDEAYSYLKNLKTPYIIKPADSSGSRGVAKISNNHDKIKTFLNNAFKYSNNSNIIIEDFIDGKEYAIEVFVINKKVNILSISEKKKIKHTKGTVAKEYFSPKLNLSTQKKIKNLTESAVTSLKYANGPGHLEIIINKNNQPFLIEFAGRGGGFKVFDKFVPILSGVNLPKITILQSIGKKVKIKKIKRSRGIIRYFPAKKGKIKEINGIEKANKLSGIIAESFVKKGDYVNKARSDGDRLGCIISFNKDFSTMKLNASKAEKIINFKFRI
tara:strand:- start:327 stop:1532 length:1206 start_codon:yes stop_codon:yes gene_type:complete